MRSRLHAWWPSIATGAAASWIFGRPATLADPPVCAGLLELVGIVASRTARDLPLGDVVFWSNRIIVFGAVVFFFRLLHAAGRDLAMTLSAIAVIAALTMSATFASSLAPTDAAAFGVAVAVLWSVLSARLTLALALLALLVAIAPALLLPGVILAIWLAFARTDRAPAHRAAWALGAVAVICLGPAVVSLAVPALPTIGAANQRFLACAVPKHGPSLAALVAAVHDGFGGASLYLFGLTALGAFMFWRSRRSPAAMWLVSFAALPLVLAVFDVVDPARSLAPAIAVGWTLVAFGLREVIVAINPRKWRWIGAAVMLLALPWLQLNARDDDEMPSVDVVRGHDRLTRQNFLQLMSAVPPGSAIVIEDAMVSMLAHDAGRRLAASGRTLSMVARDVEAIASAASQGRVFALPRGQAVAQHFGYRVNDVTGRVGIGELVLGGACVAATSDWREAASLTESPDVAFVAREAYARGPMVFVFGSDAELAPHRSWVKRAERGFEARRYDQDRESDRTELQETVRRLGLPTSPSILQSRYVVEVHVWRVPGGPHILPVTMKAAPKLAFVRRREDATAGTMWACPSFRIDARSLFEER